MKNCRIVPEQRFELHKLFNKAVRENQGKRVKNFQPKIDQFQPPPPPALITKQSVPNAGPQKYLRTRDYKNSLTRAVCLKVILK